MPILHIIFIWLFIMAGNVLWNKFRSDRRAGKNFFNFGDYNFLIASITILIVIWATFSIIRPEPNFSNPQEEIDYGTRTKQPRLVTEGYWRAVAKDPMILGNDFGLIDNYFTWGDNLNGTGEQLSYQLYGGLIYNCFNDLTADDDPAKRDVGNMFLAMYLLHDDDVNNPAMYLRQVQNKKLRYYNYLIGRMNLFVTGPETATADFETEIANHGYYKGSYEELAWIYQLTGNKEKLGALLKDPVSMEAVPEEIRLRAYFMSGNVFAFYKLKLGKMFSTLPVWGLIAGLFILFVWLLFLRRLSFLSPIKWRNFLVVVFIGVLLAMISWSIYACYHYIFKFDTNGQVGHDLLYSIFGIGFIEELVKLIPFLIILNFTNIIRRPIDYILVASAAGLGFAFFENLLYISQYGLDVIHARALTASVSHMASSAIAAYGFVLVKFRYQRQYWIIPLLFLAASAAHGFYDFWLLNSKVRSFSIITIFFYLSEILVYVSFLNNALNHSAPENYKQNDIVLNTQRLASFIGGSLVLVFALEYLANCFVYGTRIGNSTLMASFLSGGYLVFFLSVRLSNIDILPGIWGRIEFFEGLLPSELMSSRKRAGYNAVVGKKLILQLDPSSSVLVTQLPATGTLMRRLTIGEETGWFEFKPDIPLMVGTLEQELLYIRTREPGDSLLNGDAVTIGVFMRIIDPFDASKSKLRFVDWCSAM